MDKKFNVLCRASLRSKNYWSNVLSVVGDYSQFFLPILFLNSQPLKLRCALHCGFKRLPGGGGILRMIYCVHI